MAKKKSPETTQNSGSEPSVATPVATVASAVESSEMNITSDVPKYEACHYIGLFGPPKVGKTLAAAALPEAVFICTEEGLKTAYVHGLSPSRVGKTIETYPDFVAALALCRNATARFVIVDTVDGIEGILVKEVCRRGEKKSLSEFPHGRGYAALEDMAVWFVDQLRSLGKSVVLIGHTKIVTVNEPNTDSYDRYQPSLDKRVWERIKRFLDAILFAHQEVFVRDGKRAIEGERVIETQYSPAWEAGTRFNWPKQLPLDGKVLAKQIIDTIDNDFISL